MQESWVKKGAALGLSYMLGTFNDNFFKQSALLLALSLGLSHFQAWAAALFALPFVLFSAWGGWIADRFPKKHAVILAKTIELAAMLIGAWGIVHLNWHAIMLMLFCMGGSSTLFSPTLNGSIPELFPTRLVPRVNAVFKLGTTITILLGVALAGAALDQNWMATSIPFGRWLVAWGIVAAALLGLLCALFIPSWPARSGKTRRFPWLGSWNSLKDFKLLCKDRALGLILLADAFFYGFAALTLLEINALGIEEMGLSQTMTSILPAALMAGICLGAFLAASGRPDSWRHLLAPSCAGIGLALLAAAGAVHLPCSAWSRFISLFACYMLAGCFGGLYIIPVSSFIQVRPQAGEKGRVLGTGNCLTFTAILLASPAYWALHFLKPSTAHLVLGLLAVTCALFFAHAIARFSADAAPEKMAAKGARPGPPFLPLLGIFLRGLLALRYRITVNGLEKIQPDKRPILFLPNHPALVEPIILYSRLISFRPRPLSDEGQVNQPLIRHLMRLIQPVTIPDLRARGITDRKAAAKSVEEGLARCAQVLKAGGNLLFYPAGMITRDGREHLGANSGAFRLLQAVPECRVVLVRTRGLWGSSFSYAREKPKILHALARGALRLLANGLFLTPRRQVHIHVEELQELPPAQAGAAGLNKYLEAWYESCPEQGCLVPCYFWQGRESKPLPPGSGEKTDPQEKAGAPAEIRRQVYEILSAYARENGAAPDFAPQTSLSSALGLDSLSLTELAARLEQVAGKRISALEHLLTVEDCVRAAAGLLTGPEDVENQEAVPEAWLAAGPETRLSVPEAANLPLAILRQARRQAGRLILAETGTALSWREFWLKSLTLALYLRKKYPAEKRIGLLLPASTTAAISWLAALLAGKTPVMLNWTTGPANLAHCLHLAGLRVIVSAKRLLTRLEAQGFAADAAERAGASWCLLEEAVKNLPFSLKISAVMRCRLAFLGLERLALPAACPEDAAILFTSGSEALPKGVPLSHVNILANCRDIITAVDIKTSDRMLAMLPPFHALGLTVNLVMPLCFGLPAVFHANPTEAARLVRLCRLWQTTIIAAPPTFLAAMLQQAVPGDLASLRLGVVGAEACPPAVYKAFTGKTGATLCEGYGVTECGPVISVNRPGHAVPGTIGQPLPSVSVAIVSAQGPLRRVAPGETGLLLVRGPNVFSGYLSTQDAQAPEPFVNFEGAAWYRTGDLAREDENGLLTLAGRLSRFVKLGGEMISLPQIERVLLDYLEKRGDRGLDATGPALAVEALEQGAQPEIVLAASVPLNLAEANLALREAGLSPLYHVRRALYFSSLPVLGSGKTDYRMLKKMLAEQAAGKH